MNTRRASWCGWTTVLVLAIVCWRTQRMVRQLRTIRIEQETRIAALTEERWRLAAEQARWQAFRVSRFPPFSNRLAWLLETTSRASIRAGMADYDVEVISSPTPGWSRAFSDLRTDVGLVPLWFEVNGRGTLKELTAWCSDLETNPYLWFRALTLDGSVHESNQYFFHGVLQTFGAQ